jgi:hypothetical protein
VLRLLIALLPLWPAMAQVSIQVRVSDCKASQLYASDDRKEADEIDGGLGHHALTIELQNHSSSACVLQGIPAVTFLDKANHRLSVPVLSNRGHYLFPIQPVKEILLEPKGSAYVLVAYDINNGEHGEIPCRTAFALSLRLPGQRKPLSGIVIGDRYGMPSCGPIDISPFLGKPPVGGSMFAPQECDCGEFRADAADSPPATLADRRGHRSARQFPGQPSERHASFSFERRRSASQAAPEDAVLTLSGVPDILVSCRTSKPATKNSTCG